MPLRLAILRITARPPNSARCRAVASGPARVRMPLTLAVTLLLALILHMPGQIAQTETGIPPVPLGGRHVLQERQGHMPMSVALLLPWAAVSSAALLVALLLLAAEAENVPHHSSRIPQLLREPALKTITSWHEAGQLEPNGHSACLLHSQLISTYTCDTPSTNDCVYPKPTDTTH